MQASFQTKNLNFLIEFNNSVTAQAVIKVLPLQVNVSRWGDEIYFPVGIEAPVYDATVNVSIGDVAYWPEGKSVSVFFGRTIVGEIDQPIPVSPVVIIGKTLTLPFEFRDIQEGQLIKLEVVYQGSAAIKSHDDGRKLSQSEIDVLVKELLAEKMRKIQI
ncbi:MAG: cyclophilin-like fold protein [Candidatus Omnitrophota bacterium]|jgi:hypothetical protein